MIIHNIVIWGGSPQVLGLAVVAGIIQLVRIGQYLSLWLEQEVNAQ